MLIKINSEIQDSDVYPEMTKVIVVCILPYLITPDGSSQHQIPRCLYYIVYFNSSHATVHSKKLV